MTAEAAIPPTARSAARPNMIRMGTNGFVIVSSSRRRDDSRKCGDGPIDHIPATGVIRVREQFHDETHECGPWQPVLRADPHDFWFFNELGENPAQGKIADDIISHPLR